MTIKKKEVLITLTEPFEYEGKEYTSITLGRFKAGHYQYIPDELFDQADQENMSNAEKIKIGLKMMPLIAAMANVPVQVIQELSPDDFNKVSEALGPFLEQYLKTGGS